MNVQQMREEIKKLYPESERMKNLSDAQVIAVYNRLKREGKLGR